MTIKTKIMRIGAGLAMLASTYFAKADGFDSRLKLEQTAQNGQTAQVETLGIAPSGQGKHGEFFRAVDYRLPGDDNDYTAVSMSAPKDIKLSEGLAIKPRIYGVQGESKKGLGTWIDANSGNYNANVTLERLDVENGDKSTRIGAGLERKFDNLSLGVGIDQVRKGDKRTNWALVNGTYQLSKEDIVGAGLNVGDKNVQQASLVVGHYNPNELSHRTWVLLGNDENTDTKSVAFESIITPRNTALGYLAFPWIVGRGNGDMFDRRVVQDSLATPSTDLLDRVSKGIVFSASGYAQENDSGELGNVRVDAGYKFEKVGDTEFGIRGYDRYDFTTLGDDSNRVGLSILVRRELPGKANLEFIGGYERGTSGGDSGEKTSVAVQLSKRF